MFTIKDITADRLGRMDLDELRAAEVIVQDALVELHYDSNGEVRNLSNDEQAEFDRLIKLRESVNKHEVMRSILERGNVVRGDHSGDKIRFRNGRATGLIRRGVPDVSAAAVATMDRDSARDDALRLVEARSDELSANQAAHMDKLLRTSNSGFDGSYLARRTLITESPEYQSGFRQMMTEAHPLLSAEEVHALRALKELERQYEGRAMAEGTSSTGGFGVPVFIDPTINITSQGSDNPVLQLCRKTQVNTNRWKGVSSAGSTWSYDAEASVVSDDSPTLAQPTVDVFTARGFIPWSIELGEDYPGFAEEMAAILSSGYDELLTEALVTGAGTTEPTGLATALLDNTNVQLTVTTNGTVQVSDVNKMFEFPKDRYRSKGTWLMSPQVSDQVAGFASGSGFNPSFFSVDLTGVVNSLRTRPVKHSVYMESGTTVDAALMIFGDFNQYLYVNRTGMNVELLPLVVDGATGRPTGQRGWFAYARHGAGSINDSGFVLLKNKSS